MKLQADVNLSQFIHAVQTCRGNVIFVASTGDELDLKSTIAQFLLIALFSEKRNEAGEVRLTDPADLATLQPYFA